MKGKAAKAVQAEIATLHQLSAPALRARWATEFGRPAPGRVSRAVLIRAITWQIQARDYGGIRKATLRRLNAIATPEAQSNAARRDAVRLRPGTRLLRDWQGHTHTVEITEDGFIWQGQSYRSLSVIAHRITGTHWSGPRFFGLNLASKSKSS